MSKPRGRRLTVATAAFRAIVAIAAITLLIYMASTGFAPP